MRVVVTEMQPPRECETVFENGAAVLMARIVDSAGVSVRRDQVAHVVYSIRECDARDPELRRPVAGHVDVPLDVDEVFLDSLATGGLWTIDVAGYNFRHVIHVGQDSAFPKRGARYEIGYCMWPHDCPGPQIMRFLVRFKPK